MKTTSPVRSRVLQAAEWHCPQCDYSLRGSLDSYNEPRDTLRCPECGREWTIGKLFAENDVFDKPTPWWWYALASLPAGWVLALCFAAHIDGRHPTAIRQLDLGFAVMLPLYAWLGWWHASRARSMLSRIGRTVVYFFLAYFIGFLAAFAAFLLIGVALAIFGYGD